MVFLFFREKRTHLLLGTPVLKTRVFVGSINSPVSAVIGEAFVLACASDVDFLIVVALDVLVVVLNLEGVHGVAVEAFDIQLFELVKGTGGLIVAGNLQLRLKVPCGLRP